MAKVDEQEALSLMESIESAKTPSAIQAAIEAAENYLQTYSLEGDRMDLLPPNGVELAAKVKAVKEEQPRRWRPWKKPRRKLRKRR